MSGPFAFAFRQMYHKHINMQRARKIPRSAATMRHISMYSDTPSMGYFGVKPSNKTARGSAHSSEGVVPCHQPGAADTTAPVVWMQTAGREHSETEPEHLWYIRTCMHGQFVREEPEKKGPNASAGRRELNL